MTSTPAAVLLVEDEQNLALGILDNLELEGYAASWAQGGEEALTLLAQEAQDLIVLDVMLPGLDGLRVCQALRARGCETPILFLSAKNSPQERIAGLKAGGDDYLGKPFHVQELLARIHNLLDRRARTVSPLRPQVPLLRIGASQVDLTLGLLIDADGDETTLRPREMRFLGMLAAREGQTLTRDELVEGVWAEEVLPASATLEKLAQGLRQRLELDPNHPRYLETVLGVGYRLVLKDDQ